MMDNSIIDSDQANEGTFCAILAKAYALAGDVPSDGCTADSTKDEDDEWNIPEYRTSEFRMYCFKVLPCTKEHPHRWTNCPFAHAGEHACRRDPRKYEYSAVVCPDLLQTGSCPRGEACNSAHSVFEFWLHPQRYRTQICRQGPGCQRRVCFFAHTEDELREVQLPPVEDGVDPFAMAKLAKYSMSSIPEKSRKLTRSASAAKNQQKQQQEDSSRSTSPQHQPSSVSGSPRCNGNATDGDTAGASAPQCFAAEAAANGDGSSPNHRPSSDTTALRRSCSTTISTAQQQMQEAGSQANAGRAAAAGRNRGRRSMDAVCYMNLAKTPAAGAASAPVQGADLRTRRRCSLESSMQHHAAAAAAAPAAGVHGGYMQTSSNTAPLPGCNGISNSSSQGGVGEPTVHMALPPRAAVQGLVLAGPHCPAALASVSSAPCARKQLNPGITMMPAATAAACNGSSPSQWMLQQALQQQQQYSASLADVGSNPLSNRFISYSSASTLCCGGTSGATPDLMQQFSIDSVQSNTTDPNDSGNQLPCLSLDAAAAAESWPQQRMPVPLQLITPDALSLNSAGPHAAGGSSRSAPLTGVQGGAYMRVQQVQQQQGSPQVWCTAAVDAGTTLTGVPEAFGPAAAASGAVASSPFDVTPYAQQQPCCHPMVGLSGSLGSSSTVPGYSPSGPAVASAAASAVGASSPQFWAAAAECGWDSTFSNLGLAASGPSAAGPLTLDDPAVQLQHLQLNGASPVDVNGLLSSYQAAAKACRQRADLAQFAADAAHDRLIACIAALGGPAAPTAVAPAAGVYMSPAQKQQQQQLGLFQQPPGSYALQIMGSMNNGSNAAVVPPQNVAAAGGAALGWGPSDALQQQLLLLQPEQLTMLLNGQAGQLQQQQHVHHGLGVTAPITCSWI